eukprot:363096-Chlamydomonas_euryale.AAC.5
MKATRTPTRWNHKRTSAYQTRLSTVRLDSCMGRNMNEWHQGLRDAMHMHPHEHHGSDVPVGGAALTRRGSRVGTATRTGVPGQLPLTSGCRTTLPYQVLNASALQNAAAASTVTMIARHAGGAAAVARRQLPPHPRVPAGNCRLAFRRSGIVNDPWRRAVAARRRQLHSSDLTKVELVDAGAAAAICNAARPVGLARGGGVKIDALPRFLDAAMQGAARARLRRPRRRNFLAGLAMGERERAATAAQLTTTRRVCGCGRYRCAAAEPLPRLPACLPSGAAVGGLGRRYRNCCRMPLATAGGAERADA